MFSNKENINILTALLIKKGVTHAVVCPGSRNAPIVHNLNEADGITCHPVTDERSAGFYAIGLAQATGQPVVVCVTSGSALLNVAPAVAEAFYQHIPLIVVSADRPQQWIGQLDGQTLPQPGAFGTMVRHSVQLPEPHNDEERWLCRRLINEALHLCTCRQAAPVHINVPITEPLFSFNVEQLPQVSLYRSHNINATPCADNGALQPFLAAQKPMIVMGQTANGVVSDATLRSLSARFVVLAEPLSNSGYTVIHADEAARLLLNDKNNIGEMMGRNGETVGCNDITAADFLPDYVLYLGDTLVSKALRQLLRRAKAPTSLVTPDASQVPDPLMTLTDIVECPLDKIDALLASLASNEAVTPSAHDFHARWQTLLAHCADHAEGYEPPYSQMATVRYFESQLEDLDIDLHVHYANSSAVRLASIYAAHRVWCNRGVNGIEGSLSTAAGFSLATPDMVVCVIGDLSFFYDQNALWNSQLRGNLRIILLNNHGGGIFSTLPGLEASAAAHDMVAATHNADARGICTQNDIGYLKANNIDEMQLGIVTLLTQQTDRPMLLEVFTNAEEDAKAMKDYLRFELKK